MKKATLISIKPEFMEKILSNSKTIELRKSAPKVVDGSIIVLYSSSPVKAIVGYCICDGIIKASPKELWQEYNQEFGIDAKRYFEDFSAKEEAVGIRVKNVVRFPQPISLELLRCIFPKFWPPQSYRYLSKAIIEHGLNVLNKNGYEIGRVQVA